MACATGSRLLQEVEDRKGLPESVHGPNSSSRRGITRFSARVKPTDRQLRRKAKAISVTVMSPWHADACLASPRVD